MASRRALTWGGAALAAGAGYYLYQAGGNPKVAEKKFERDASKLTSRSKGQEAKADFKLHAEETGQKIDQLTDQIKSRTREADKKIESYRQNAEKNITEYKEEAGKNINSAIDKFDKKVEEGATKSKGWVSGFFGGGK